MTEKKYYEVVGPYKVITGKFYNMYYSPDVIIDCQKLSPNGKWILGKSTKQGLFKLGSYPTRAHCLCDLRKEIGL